MIRPGQFVLPCGWTPGAISTTYTAVVSIERLIDPTSIHRVGLVGVAGLVGFVGNELVAHYRIRVGRPGRVPPAHAIMGLVITLALLGVLRTTARDFLRRLMDSVDPELVDQVEHVLAGVEGVERVERVRIRWVGHQLQAEATIVSGAQLTLAAAHANAERAHHQLLHEFLA
jgi:divalent metal cation (Fe/Co/Zn/Cd) transporter